MENFSKVLSITYGDYPKDWQFEQLGNIGYTYSGLRGKSKDDFIKGNCPYIPFTNIMSNVVINNDNFEFVQVSKFESQNLALKEDLFFNGSSETPEEVGMCSVLLNDVPNLYLNSFCFGFRFYTKSIVFPLFLVYFFRSSIGRKILFPLAQGYTRYNLSKSAFLDLFIPIPPFPEQRAIAEVLSDVDALIEAQEALIEKKRLIKQGMMQELLTGKRQLSGFSGDWVTIQVKDVFDLKRGQVLATSKIMDAPIGDYKYPVYSSQTQNNGLLGFYDDHLFEDCITWTTDGANAGDVNFRSGKFYCTNVCGVCINNSDYSNKCIAGIINRVSREYVSYVGNPKLMNNVFAEITVNIPSSVDDQKEISKVIDDFDKEINLLELKLGKLKLIKQGMMQELLTGRTRLV